VLFSRQILDLIPNPWIAHDLGNMVLNKLIKKHGRELVKNNFLFILESVRELIRAEKNRLAKDIFMDLLEQKIIKFGSIGNTVGFRFPDKVTYQSPAPNLLRLDHTLVQKSLFEYNPEDNFNPQLEKPAVDTIDKSEFTQFWYRNIAKHDYNLQGWQPGKVYPDFIVSTADKSVLVIETKGEQLLGNQDTTYKHSLFNLCNELSGQIFTNDLGLELEKLKISYHMIYGDSWHSQLNEILQSN
jgi:type III restriction enzyme